MPQIFQSPMYDLTMFIVLQRECIDSLKGGEGWDGIYTDSMIMAHVLVRGDKARFSALNRGGTSRSTSNSNPRQIYKQLYGLVYKSLDQLTDT